METMHAGRRRTLPPVPRVAGDRVTPAPSRSHEHELLPGVDQDAAQQFVERLRTTAPEFAEAAGAASAVVREVVPPARHRRARCRVVLRFADDTETDVTLLGPTGNPATPSRHGFDRQIRRWLGTGLPRKAAWLVPDADAPDGLAVDLSAWIAAS
jgi:hypothetical protein